MSQNNSSFRKALRSALSHKKMANDLLDVLVSMQTQFNAAMDKLDADDTASLDIDYVSTCAISSSSIIDADAAGTDAQHLASYRRSLRSALMNKKLADAILNSFEGIETNFNDLLAKLDAEAGTLDDVDYVSLLEVSENDPDAVGHSQHKASLRKTLRVSLANKRLADAFIDALYALETNMNLALAQLDFDANAGTGALVGLYTPFKVDVIDPSSY